MTKLISIFNFNSNNLSKLNIFNKFLTSKLEPFMSEPPIIYVSPIKPEPYECCCGDELEPFMSEPPIIHEPPIKPEPHECCGDGCGVCVWDIYIKDLEEYYDKIK